MKQLFLIFISLSFFTLVSQEQKGFFKKADVNSDGFLDKKEFSTNKYPFDKIDLDNNGILNQKEIFQFFIVHRKRQNDFTPKFELAEGEESITITNQKNCEAAAKYSATVNGVSTLVLINGKIVFEQYDNGGGITKANALASGTKSFTGILAMVAKEEGLLSLNEKVSETIAEWKNDTKKSDITIHQLLNLTSGLESNTAMEKEIPSYSESIDTKMIHKAGETFGYGAQPFQVFGELMSRKLMPLKITPLEYLEKKVFDPIGLTYDWWAYQKNDPKLPSGALITARNWALFGELIRKNGNWGGKQLISKESLDLCFIGSEANPAYGLTWWLNEAVAKEKDIPLLKKNFVGVNKNASIPKDLVMAAGSGKQRLYVSRKENIVIVRQSNTFYKKGEKGPSFEDNVFLSLLFTGKKP